MTVAWTDDLRDRVWSLAEKGMSHRAIAKWIGGGLTKGSVSGQITLIREKRGIPAADNYREIDVVTRRDQIELSHRLLARLLKYHGDNPPDADSAIAARSIARIVFPDMFPDSGLEPNPRPKPTNRESQAISPEEIETRRRSVVSRQDNMRKIAAHLAVDDHQCLPVRMIDLAAEIAGKHGITVDELRGERRNDFLIPARFEFCFRANRELNKSTAHIGRFLGGRDHTKVIHAIRQYEERMKRNDE